MAELIPSNWRELVTIAALAYAALVAAAYAFYRFGRGSEEGRLNALLVIVLTPISLAIMALALGATVLFFFAATAD
ncbi:MAG: hypothetical protein QOJ38_1379 [Solirubrobacterales bacterium]|jgi:hypothetical protein|nr:hypothetical protein [Solirubrobacterales bacterium]